MACVVGKVLNGNGGCELYVIYWHVDVGWLAIGVDGLGLWLGFMEAGNSCDSSTTTSLEQTY